jgi:hypothetical protein
VTDFRNSAHRLASDALASYREEYRELSETWRHLESKAQGTVAIAGIFLAGVFAFVRALSESAGIWDKILLLAAVSLLVLSVLSAILALRVRQVAGPPVGDSLDALVKDLLGPEGATQEDLVAFVRDQTGMWADANKDVHEHNQTKAGHLFRAQILLLIAILVVAFLTGMAVL